MDIKEIIANLKNHFKEQFNAAKENKKIYYHNNKIFVQANKDAWKEIQELHPNKQAWEQAYYVDALYQKKLLELRSKILPYSSVTDSNEVLTLKHILYNRLRNKTRGHTHDDQKYIDTHKAVAKLICERMGLQQEILEQNHVQS